MENLTHISKGELGDHTHSVALDGSVMVVDGHCRDEEHKDEQHESHHVSEGVEIGVHTKS